MITTDFYTGEPVITGSPPTFSNPNIIGQASQDEMEATNLASFGKYDYDPGTRNVAPMMQSTIYPGGYGYNQNFGMYMQPPQYGIGAYSYGQPQYQYSTYGNIQPTYSQYRYGYQPYYYQQPQMPTTYHINGVGNNGEFMPPADYEKRINELQSEYWAKQQEIDAQRSVDISQSAYNNPYGYSGYNYYGTPYYNPYQYNSLNNEMMQKAKELEDEARQNRMDFDMKIARLAHGFVKDGISEEALRERYMGKDVPIPQAIIPNYEDYYMHSHLLSMVPYDNSQEYRDFHASVSREFHQIVGADMNLKDTFANMGIIAAQWEMEEEMHRRKDAGNLYNSGDNSYKYFVRKKAQERYCQEKGIQMLPGGQGFNAQQAKKDFVNSSSVLSQSASLADDGTLNISLNIPCNVGSHAGEVYTVNQNEAEYQERRERFGRFLDSIPGNIYLDNQKEKKMSEFG